MMYSNKLAVAVKANGKVLREFGESVYVPFGSEYTILIKNLNSVRAQVRIDIDGTDATEDTWLIIQPNSSLELERFIKSGNLKEGNRFKFIERTAGVEKHRGIGVEDGLIRIEYQFEKPQPIINIVDTYWKKERWVKETYYDTQPFYNSTMLIGSKYDSPTTYGSGVQGGMLRGLSANSISGQAEIATKSAIGNVGVAQALFNASAASVEPAALLNEAGITVAGSKSDQTFHMTSSFPVEATTHVMVVKLLGETETGKAVKAPVTVKAKPKCTTCGHQNKATAKFCSECGTSLEIV